MKPTTRVCTACGMERALNKQNFNPRGWSFTATCVQCLKAVRERQIPRIKSRGFVVTAQHESMLTKSGRRMVERLRQKELACQSH